MKPTLLDDIAAAGGPAVFPLSVEQYHRMLETGILQDGDPVELIEGLLVRKNREAPGMVQRPAHAFAITQLGRLDRRLEGLACHVRVQLPIVASEASEPEPDVAVDSGMPDRYAAKHPAPPDVLLVIEVSERSLANDRKVKQRLYAAAGIPRYWIVNLRNHCLEAYEDPRPTEGVYARRDVVHLGATAILELPAGRLEIVVASLFETP